MNFEKFANDNGIKYNAEEFKTIKRMITLTTADTKTLETKIDLACMNLAKEAGEVDYIVFEKPQRGIYDLQREETLKSIKGNIPTFSIFVAEEEKTLLCFPVKIAIAKYKELEKALEYAEKEYKAASEAKVNTEKKLKEIKAELEKKDILLSYAWNHYNTAGENIKYLKNVLSDAGYIQD